MFKSIPLKKIESELTKDVSYEPNKNVKIAPFRIFGQNCNFEELSSFTTNKASASKTQRNAVNARVNRMWQHGLQQEKHKCGKKCN